MMAVAAIIRSTLWYRLPLSVSFRESRSFFRLVMPEPEIPPELGKISPELVVVVPEAGGLTLDPLDEPCPFRAPGIRCLDRPRFLIQGLLHRMKDEIVRVLQPADPLCHVVGKGDRQLHCTQPRKGVYHGRPPSAADQVPRKRDITRFWCATASLQRGTREGPSRDARRDRCIVPLRS